MLCSWEIDGAPRFDTVEEIKEHCMGLDDVPGDLLDHLCRASPKKKKYVAEVAAVDFSQR